MKKIIIFILFFSFTYIFEGMAQEPGDTKVLASRNSMKGRRELQKEKKVQRKEKHLLRRTEKVKHRKQKDNKQVIKLTFPKKKRNREKTRGKKHHGTGTQNPPQ